LLADALIFLDPNLLRSVPGDKEEPMKRSRMWSALAAFSINAVLLTALTLTGRVNAEPSTEGSKAQTATATARNDTPAEPPVKAKPRSSVVRKVLPVREFGGY
jgi:hypothetical protein